MASSLLNPTPPSEPEDYDYDRRPPGGSPPPPAPPRGGGRGPGRRGLALLLIFTALGGGVAGAGLLLLTGAGDGDGASTTTTVTEATTAAAAQRSDASAGLDARTLYANANPGVVDITSRGISSSGDSASPFGGSGQSATATGTGFVVDGKGHIVTAAHVVEGASSISVKFQNGTTRTAKVLGTDEATDVAVLSVDPSGLTLHPLALGSSASLSIGDEVAAIGDPFTYDRSLSTGVVSGLDRTISAPNGFTVAHAIQTDAALNPGNSGGPVLDASGRVIGIVDQIATNGSSQTSSGVGFAVPIDLVRSELSKLEAGQTVRHAYLGVSTSDLGTGTAGALIQSVSSSGPAAGAGLRSGDVVTHIGSAAIKGTNDLVAAVAARAPGDRVQVTVKRGSSTQTVTVTLGTQPTQAAQSGQTP